MKTATKNAKKTNATVDAFAALDAAMTDADKAYWAAASFAEKMNAPVK